MVSSPLVSICIPAYLQTKQLKKTLDSIASQDFQDFELLLSDDSPDDRVEQLLKEYSFGAQLSYWRNSPSKGSPENWNHVASKAKGKYIKIMHHDDWFTTSDALRKFVELMQRNPEADFGFSAAYSWFGKKDLKELYSPGDEQINKLKEDPLHLLLANLIGAPSATIIKKSAFQQFDKTLIWLVDIEYYIRVISQNPSFVFTTEPLVTTSGDEDHQITNDCVDDLTTEIKEHFYVFNKHQTKVSEKLEKKYLNHLFGLITKHQIKSVKEIRKCGYIGPVPSVIRFYFAIKPFAGSYSVKGIHKLIALKQKLNQ